MKFTFNRFFFFENLDLFCSSTNLFFIILCIFATKTLSFNVFFIFLFAVPKKRVNKKKIYKNFSQLVKYMKTNFFFLKKKGSKPANAIN